MSRRIAACSKPPPRSGASSTSCAASRSRASRATAPCGPSSPPTCSRGSRARRATRAAPWCARGAPAAARARSHTRWRSRGSSRSRRMWPGSRSTCSRPISTTSSSAAPRLRAFRKARFASCPTSGGARRSTGSRDRSSYARGSAHACASRGTTSARYPPTARSISCCAGTSRSRTSTSRGNGRSRRPCAPCCVLVACSSSGSTSTCPKLWAASRCPRTASMSRRQGTARPLHLALGVDGSGEPRVTGYAGRE